MNTNTNQLSVSTTVISRGPVVKISQLELLMTILLGLNRFSMKFCLFVRIASPHISNSFGRFTSIFNKMVLTVPLVLMLFLLLHFNYLPKNESEETTFIKGHFSSSSIGYMGIQFFNSIDNKLVI